MKPFVDEAGDRALRAAIKAIEARSAVEVVIAIRHHSGSYLHADLIAGIVAGWAALAFMLFSPFDFSLMSILIDPAVAGALVGLVHTQLPASRRWLTPRSRRRQRVAQAARATFFDKGVRRTRDRTGVLVYASLLERMVEVVADSGVVDAVDADAWRRTVTEIERTLADAMNAVALAGAIEALGPVCERALPRAADDENELPDEVCAP
ncbi:MAG: hypothetical protein D6689_15120 [Deltaproteobacteria bacterium]|nr:MAG: hypothetical protein D6689_15120 [Deltaproteobacteria bacterium]